jgi:hypothetical protein
MVSRNVEANLDTVEDSSKLGDRRLREEVAVQGRRRSPSWSVPVGRLMDGHDTFRGSQFVLSTKTGRERLEHFWLRGECSKTMILICVNQSQVKKWGRTDTHPPRIESCDALAPS